LSERARAALINALVFPGMGQLLILNRRVAGIVYLASSAVALVTFCVAMWLRLRGLVESLRADQLVSLWALLERVAEALRHPGGLAVSSLLVLGVCWLLALLDALLVPARSGGAE